VTTVLVVDDQSMIRMGLRAILDAHDDLSVVGEAADGRGALHQVKALRPDVVMMDVRMPVMDGLEAARSMLADGGSEGYRPRVLMLTTFDIDDYVYEALRAGASGFLLKDGEPEDVVRAVRVVAAGEALLSPVVTRRLIESFVEARPRPLEPDARLGDLTHREREVFRLIALGRSNTEIADELFIVEQTVKSHVSRVLRKLDLRDRVQAVVLGYESGLVVPGRTTPGGPS
jgi:DNA-binding NarL/FixJ family response regulator